MLYGWPSALTICGRPDPPNLTGSMIGGMTTRTAKTTITLDPEKMERARRLTGARSASETVDIALARLIATETLRRDITAYAASPPTDEELMLAEAPVVFDLNDAEVDYDALYGGSGA